MEFLHPSFFWLALFIPALLFLRFRRRPRAVPMPGLSAIKGVRAARWAWLPVALFAAACLVLLAASARPRIPLGEEEKKLVGVDVALALDVSGSMLAEDFSPNRMEAAKAKVKEFVAGFGQGRMALVAFAGRSFTQCPLTTDAGILEGLVDQLDVGSVALDGTAIGDAIINCVDKFKEPSVSRVIVLLTDGQNNSGSVDPITAARAAKAKGIKIYAIGVGTKEGAPVPAYNAVGEKFYLQDPYGNTVMAKVDEETLRQVAEVTGGEFFRAEDEKALGEVYAKIAAMEKKEIKIKRIKGYRELFPWFAAAGLALLVLGAAAQARWRVLE